MTSPNAKGPAEAATSPSHGSPNPGKDKEMNKRNHIIEDTSMPVLSRRRLFAGLSVVAIPAAAAAELPRRGSGIDDFLASALPSEKARYHANALAEAMTEMHPDKVWRSHIDHDRAFCLVVGDEQVAI